MNEEYSKDKTTNDAGQTTKEKWDEMKDERKNNDQDPALSTPQEANTQKHISSSEGETGEKWEEMKEERMNNDREPS